MTPPMTNDLNPAGVATHRHVKRGSEYVFIAFGLWTDTNRCNEDDADLNVVNDAPGVWSVTERYYRAPERSGGEWARLQTNGWVNLGDVVAIYRSVDDGSLWVRPREEFEDGRFEAIQTSTEAGR